MVKVGHTGAGWFLEESKSVLVSSSQSRNVAYVTELRFLSSIPLSRFLSSVLESLQTVNILRNWGRNHIMLVG